MSLAEKQAYLNSAIAQGSKQHAKFVAFLAKNKDKKSDLSRWSLEELKKAVVEFNSKEEENESEDGSSVSSLDSDDEVRIFGKRSAGAENDNKSDKDQSGSDEEVEENEKNQSKTGGEISESKIESEDKLAVGKKKSGKLRSVVECPKMEKTVIVDSPFMHF